MTVFTGAITTPAVTTTGTLQRTVSDTVRELFPQATPLNALIAKGPTTGGQTTSAGRIGKRTSKTMKFEAFVYDPIAVQFTVASLSGSDPLVPVLTAATGLRVNMTLMNPRTGEVGVIDAVSTNTLTMVAITSTWVPIAGDHLISMAPAYKEGSSNVGTAVVKVEDNIYNFLQIIRIPMEIAITAKNNPNYGPAYWESIKSRVSKEGYRLLENTLLAGERAVTETTTTANLGSVYSTRGLLKWAQKSFDCNGAMSPEKFAVDLALALGNTINDSDDRILFCGRHIAADVMSWTYDKWTSQKTGDLEVIGLKSNKILTAGPTIHVVKHNFFDQVGMQKKALLFRPDDVFYYSKEGMDMKPYEGIQANDAHTQKDEISGCVGLLPTDGGAEIMSISNWATTGAV